MRTTIVGIILTITAATAQDVIGQTLPPDVGAGRIAWFDLSTGNLARSREFYGRLFGWQFRPVQGTTHTVEIVAGEAGIGTLRGAEGRLSEFNGVVYVQVNDLQASCELAQELGATIVSGFPFNLPGGIGAIALMIEPGGHPIGMYSRTPLPQDH